MDKEMLFRFMRSKFRDAGFTPDEIELHIRNFSDRYEGRSDEEIEADMMRRGGPSKAVARVIEQRNSVLMKDAEYRAFVEGVAYIEPEEAAPVSTQEEAPAADDPLCGWFSDTDNETSEEDVLRSLLAGDASKVTEPVRTEQTVVHDEALPILESEDGDMKIAGNTESARPAETSENETTRAIPTVKATQTPPEAQTAPTMSVVHTIPLFEDPPTPKPRNVPPRRSAPAEERGGDDGSTKIIGITTETPRPTAVPPRQAQPASPDPLYTPQPVTDDYRRPGEGMYSGQQGTYAPPVRSNRKKGQKQLPQFLRLPEITYWGEGSLEGVRRFRIIFGVSLPFVIVLCAALIALLLGLTAAIAVAVIALVVALVVWVAVGSIIALVGIIYGISQLFLVTPVGMFELGLGIAAVGITMLGGILIYNLAVRFFPFVLRQIYRFAGFLRHYIVDLYYYVKGECYRR